MLLVPYRTEFRRRWEARWDTSDTTGDTSPRPSYRKLDSYFSFLCMYLSMLYVYTPHSDDAGPSWGRSGLEDARRCAVDKACEFAGIKAITTGGGRGKKSVKPTFLRVLDVGCGIGGSAR